MIEFFVIGALGVALLFSKSFDLISIILSCVYGIVIWRLRGVEWIIVLMTFLFTSLYATKYGCKRIGKEHEHRGADNVMSNGIVAFMSAVFGLNYLYLGSISAALSDTLASEIGKVSKEKPVLITNLKKEVEPGVNGGITKLGTFASFGGGFIIAMLSIIFYSSFEPNGLPRAILFFAVLIGGFMGSIVDSILGVIFENRKVMSNGSVNFSATLIGGLITWGIVALFG